MITVTSLSGGKTSAYMALKYPSDKYVFALVKTDDPNSISSDKGLIKAVQEKIPDFIASRELDDTLKNVLNLEQRLGTEITWVSAGETFDQLIARKKMLPNQRLRFCTTELKIKPIFQYCFFNFGLVIMNIGFRHDEKNRAKKLLSTCDKAYYFIWEGKKIEWRIPNFPLIENQITHNQISIYSGRKQKVKRLLKMDKQIGRFMACCCCGSRWVEKIEETPATNCPACFSTCSELQKIYDKTTFDHLSRYAQKFYLDE